MRSGVVVRRSPVIAFIVGALLLLSALVAAPIAAAGTGPSAAPAVHSVEVAPAVHIQDLRFEIKVELDRRGFPAEACVLPCIPICAGTDANCVPPLTPPPTAPAAAALVRNVKDQSGQHTVVRPVIQGRRPATPSLTQLSISRV